MGFKTGYEARINQSIDRSIESTCIEIPETNENVTTLSINTVRNGRVKTVPFTTGLIRLNIVELLDDLCSFVRSFVSSIQTNRSKEKRERL